MCCAHGGGEVEASDKFCWFDIIIVRISCSVVSCDWFVLVLPGLPGRSRAADERYSVVLVLPDRSRATGSFSCG